MATQYSSLISSGKVRASLALALLLPLVGVNQSMALETDDIRITNQGSVYQVRMTFDIGAPVDQIIEILTDYGFPNRLDPDITKRDVISRAGGVTRVRTETRGCVFFFCKEIKLTQDVTVVADVILADIVPADSDFRSGYLRWTIAKNDKGGSHIDFEADMEPDAFIPPLIGKFFVMKNLRKQVLATAENLEKEALRESVSVTSDN